MLKHWIWLAERKGVGLRTALRVQAHFETPERAYFADRAELALVDGLTERQREALMDKDLTAAEQILEICERKQIRLLTMQDAAYPERLRNIPDPPLVLYYRGSIPDVDSRPTICIVGSREATAYGLLQAKKFGYQLGSAGVIVVSGLARGVDTFGMEGALTADAPVIGVLGCGVDVVYPAESRGLYKDVETRGWLISEFPPGTRPEAKNFPVRNRIMSALSVGVLVVECARKSGALITAQRALEQGKDVFAIPSNLGVAGGEGSNQLIRDGAIMVTCAQDILSEYVLQFPGRLTPTAAGEDLTLSQHDLQRSAGREKRIAEPVRTPAVSGKISIDKKSGTSYIDVNNCKDSLSADEWQLAQQLTQEPKHVDDLIEAAQLPASRALAALTLLELKGIAARLPGRRYGLMELEKEE